MGRLEFALTDGLPAQSPHSDAGQIIKGIAVLRAKVDETLKFVERAEQALKQANL